MKANKQNKRDIDRTRKQIIEAAAIEFAANGFKGARVDIIAKRANISKAMIYYIFGDKEKLHLVVFKELMERKTQNIFDTIENDSMDLGTFFQMLGTYFDDLTDVKEYSQIFFDDISSGAKALHKLKEENPDLFTIMDKVTLVIKNLKDGGGGPSLDPQKTAVSIVILMVSFTCILPYMDLFAPEGSKEHKDLTDLSQWKQFFMSTLLNLAPRQPRYLVPKVEM